MNEIPTLEPNGGNFYEPHMLMVNSGRFWRCKHGITGFDGDLNLVGCPECRAENPTKAATLEKRDIDEQPN